jgi:hypothetical protein
MTSDSMGPLGDPGTLVIIAIAIPLLISLVTYIWYALTLAKVFSKLGGEPWKAWVPIANEVEIFVRGGLPGWNAVYLFIPLLNIYGIILHIQAVHRINVLFGRGAGLTVLHIVSAPIWATVLAFSSGSRAQGSVEARVAQASGAQASGAHVGVMQPGSVEPAQAFGAVPPPPPPMADVPIFEVVNEPVPAPAEPVETPKLIGNPWAPVPAADAAPAVVPPPVVPPTAPPAATTPLIVPPPPPVAVIPAPPIVDEPAPAVVAEVPAPPVVAEMPEAPEAAPPAPVIDSDPTIVVPAPAAVDDDDDDEDYETVVVDRRPVVTWSLVLDDGRSFPLTATTIALGRKPESTNASAQLLPITDSTRTLSKTHAILDLTDGKWTITDLNSTNGVLTVDDADVETLVESGSTVAVAGRFILGKVGMRVNFEEGASS